MYIRINAMLAFALATIPAVSNVCAQGTAFTYQGQLKSGGAGVSGSYDFQFKLFDAWSAGTQQGVSLMFDGLGPDPAPVAVTSGLFTVTLDFGSQFAGAARYLETSVRPHATGSYTTLTPRQPLTPAPYAVYAAGPWVTSGANLSYTLGQVGIGTSNPSNRLTVMNPADGNTFVAIDSGISATQTSGLRFNDQGASKWTINKTTSNDLSIREVASNADRLYIAQGGNVGIGTNNPANQLSVAGDVNVTGRLGIGTASPAAILDVETSFFQAAQFTTTDTSSVAVGVLGTSSGVGGKGVYGQNSANSGIGVQGSVYATSSTNYGVKGFTQSPSGYGVYSEGRFAATGTKSFQIDHPLDPANQYLNHYCTEGPEPLNVYRGHVVLDDAGTARVQLPAYFESINRDFEYQLTPVGGPAPNLHVAARIQSNRFKIGGGAPGLEVSWRVEAVRNDAWVRAYGAPVEQAKPAEQCGKYLAPELFGRPREGGIHYQPPAVTAAAGR